MKRYGFLRKTLAVALAAITGLTAFQAASLPVQAADSFFVKFVDNITKKQDYFATLLEGESMSIVKQTPDNYSYADPAFVQSIGEGETATPGIISTSNTAYGAEITAGINLVGNKQKLFNIRPSFNAMLSKSSTGSVTYTVPKIGDDGLPTSETETKQIGITADVITSGGLSVKQEGTITFTTTADQTANGQISTFSRASADGGLREFNGALVTCLGASTQRPGELYVEIAQQGAGSSSPSSDGTSVQQKIVTLRINSDTGATADLFPSNTKFSLTFRQETINDLQLTVISRQFAVDEIARDVIRNFDNTDHGYVYFQGDDKKNSITKDFNLKKNVKEYNYKDGFRIDWSWEQTQSNIPTCIAIKDKNPGGEQIAVEIINRPLEDAQGYLVANVNFVKGDSTPKVNSTVTVKIGITIRGSGTLPSIQANTESIGRVVDGQRKDIVKSLVYNAFPSVMDVYSDEAKEWSKHPDHPYTFAGSLNFGDGLSAANSIMIETGANDKGAVDIFVGGDVTSKYVPGTPIKNINTNGVEYHTPFVIQAIKKGMVTLKVSFLNSKNEAFATTKYLQINILDTSPSSDARMGNIEMRGNVDENATDALKKRFQAAFPDGTIPYGFDKDIFNYEGELAITVPSMVKSIKLAPKYFNSAGENGIITASWVADGREVKQTSIEPDFVTDDIPLTLNVPQTITLYGTAEDGTKTPVYILVVTRTASENSNLKSLSVVTKDGKEQIADFDPIKTHYDIELDYSFRGTGTTLTAVAEDSWVQEIDIKGPIEKGLLASLQQLLFSNTAKLDLVYRRDPESGAITNTNQVTVRVLSESGKQSSAITYTVTLKIKDPSEDNQLSQLDIFRTDTNEKLVFDNKQQFAKEGRDFYLTIPYSVNELQFSVLPNDEKAQKVRFTPPKNYQSSAKEYAYTKKGTPIDIRLKVPASDPVKPEQKQFDAFFEVLAERENDWTAIPYAVHITRADPDIDARLESMTVTDVDTNTPVAGFTFNAQKNDYTISVPFTTTGVTITPVVKSKLSKATVNGTKISATNPGKEIVLKQGETVTVTVQVIPEGGVNYANDYVLKITRQKPASEARLLSLTVGGGENMQPTPFVPDKTSYSVDIPQGTKSFTVTPTLVDPKATISVDGKTCASGAASEPIVTTTANQTVNIVVTAEDGKTTKTYTLKAKNYNYMKKSSDATLSALEVDYGDMKPGFRSTVGEYEVYVKSTAMDLTVTPHLSNSGATMKVFADSVQLTEYDGSYSNSLLADKTQITIEITAEDGTEKTYTLNVYRNNKKKQGNLTPITDAMVDYTSTNPILIDITNYAVVDASVFNTLKASYPEKTILFQGNDYSLQIKGTDVNGLVPHTTTYDLRFSFTTPEESLIQDALWEADDDQLVNLEELEPVYLHFDDHGALPGKMLLTVNLGREYSNSQLFWNYYNTERARIDYYGYVSSNAKGGFSVPLTHLSTYFITKEKILSAENKVGVTTGGVGGGGSGNGTGSTSGTGDSENMGNTGSTGKTNPKTGVPD